MLNSYSHSFIRNDCTNAPPHLEKHVYESLSHFTEAELNGVGLIWLVNDLPDDADEEYKKVIRMGGQINGFYYFKTEEEPPFILLFINSIYRSLRLFPFIHYTVIPSLCISRTLAHEIGHHLIAIRGYVFNQGEDTSDQEVLANQYARNHLEKMRSRFRYRFGFWLMKQLAELHYSAGVVYSTKQKYCEAADCLYKAWDLNPKLENVAEWYHLAREKCHSNKESSTNNTG